MSLLVPAPDDDRAMGRTYLLVVLCQVAVTIALWWFGHAFSN